MEKTKISVIVPIYKVEKYLRKCIESLVNQTYQNLEIILVDDGSPDNCGAICDEYAAKDDRIHVIHQPNSGVAKARNVAIDFFHGEYVVFIDSDDFVEPQMMELLMKLHEENDCTYSMVLGRIVYEPTPSEFNMLDLSKVRTRILSQDDMMKGLFSLSDMNNYEFQVVWNKLFPRDLIKGAYFLKTGTDDTEYNSRIYLKTEKVACGMVPMYYWVQRQSSITHEPINDRQIDKMNTYYIMLNTFKGHQNYQAYCLDYMYKVILNVRHMAKGTSYEPRVKKECKHYKELTFKELLGNNTLPLYRRLGLACLYHMPFAYDLIIWAGEKAAKIRKR